jgi:K+-sensing histidine kinase KdpD
VCGDAPSSDADEFVRSGEVVLVGLPAEALRRRIAAGHVYFAESVGGALAEYFWAADLEPLSQLAEAWMLDSADTVGEELLARPWAGRPAIPTGCRAGISASGWGERVIRRAAELAAEDDAELLLVHVNVANGFAHPPGRLLDRVAMRQSSWAGHTPRSAQSARRTASPESSGPVERI